MLAPILDPLAFGFFVRALIAAGIVGLVCAVVGCYMVLRGLAFMGDAISHSAFPGRRRGVPAEGPFYLGAVVAAVGTALAIGWISRRGNLRGDTVIGVLFAGMFSLGVFLFSTIHNYVGDLFGFLFGEILGISPTDLIALSVLAAIVLIVVVVLWKELLYATFDPLGAAASGLPVGALDYLFLALIALTIVVSLQAVGIILVVAMLVTPAATAQLHHPALRPADGHRRDDRGDLPGDRAVFQLLAEHGQRGHDRAGRDDPVPGHARSGTADRAPSAEAATGLSAAVRRGRPRARPRSASPPGRRSGWWRGRQRRWPPGRQARSLRSGPDPTRARR